MTGPTGDASPSVVLRSADGATATVHFDGAHVTSWRPAPDGEERLFLSERSEWREGVAIRGGVPVIFPQFAAEGPLPRHGFARTTRWTLDDVIAREDGDAIARFHLDDSAATRAIWPVAFQARITVRVGGPSLSITLAVTNHDRTPITFTAALHTYLRVHDVADTVVEGLYGQRYRESGAPGVLKVDDEPVYRPSGEVDRLYMGVVHPLALRERGRSLAIASENMPDVVLWNPGPAKAAALRDMEPGGERHMLCIEAAAVQVPVRVAAGDTWSGTQRLEAYPRAE